jgi:4-hydroxy-3-methylbut-2-enyl diphosphate reductase
MEGVTVADVLRLRDRPALLSPAGMLVAGELAARGVPVAQGPLSARHIRRQTFVSRVPLVVSAEIGDGIGLAIAAMPARLPEVRDVLDRWLSVVAERTVLLATPRSFGNGSAATSRQRSLTAVATYADLVLVIGSANSTRLAGLARRCGSPAHVIDGPADIRAEWLAGVRTIGLTAGVSASRGLVAAVVDAIAGLGGVRVIERDSARETIQFALPSPGKAPVTQRAYS